MRSRDGLVFYRKLSAQKEHKNSLFVQWLLLHMSCFQKFFSMDVSDTSSTFTCSSLCTSWDPDEHDEPNMWNPTLGLFCHVQVGVFTESYSYEVCLERIALSSHFAFDFL